MSAENSAEHTRPLTHVVTNTEHQSLPTGWMSKRLDDLLLPVDVRAGDLPPDQAADLVILSLTKRRGLIPQAERFGKRIATNNVSRYKVVRTGQIVYNPYVIWEGAVHALRNLPAGIVSPVYPVLQTREPDGGYLDYLLRTSILISHYNRLCSGAVNRRRSIRPEAFGSIEVKVPPLPERRAIAATLRTVQRAMQACDRVIATASSFKQSLLHHVFTYGPVSFSQIDRVPLKQTEIGLVPEHWASSRLVDLLCEPLRNGHSAAAHPTNEGIRTLTLTAVTRNDFSAKNTKLTVADPKRVKDMWLKRGDIFVERANSAEHVGLAALYGGDDDFAIFPDLLIRVRVAPERAEPKFVVEQLLKRETRKYYQMNAKKTAGNFPKIDQVIVENTPLALPSLAEQRQIAVQIMTIDAKLAAERALQTGLARIFQSLLHNLMTGKLRLSHLVDQLDPEAVR
jgi:type I restriction enzyme, S subunit